ncbi:MAG: endonuclease/exonuclease/phosphatase family protein [Candidatus Binataceae bacterium]
MDTSVSIHECTIATYNIFHDLPAFRHLDRRLEIIAEHIAARRPDVVALQELVRASRCGELQVKLVRLVNQACGEGLYTIHYTPADGAGEGEYAFEEGVALMTLRQVAAGPEILKFRSQVSLSTTIAGHRYRLPDDRVAMWIRLRLAHGELDVYVTHLTDRGERSDNGASIRCLQARELAAWINQRSGDEVTAVVAGDFNDLPESEAVMAMSHAGFVDVYAVAGKPPGYTNDSYDLDLESPRGSHNQRIDFIFARPPHGGGLNVSEARLFIDEPHREPENKWLWPSDHIGVVATLRL